MKRRKFIKTAGAAGLGLTFWPVYGQDSTNEVSDIGEDLDLYAVLELLEESEDLEAFEKALNSEDKGVNNLDLNEDGEVDYIKVDESIEEGTHLIILQVEIEENEFQDVATIEIERQGNEDYIVQAVGAEEFYGEDYIVEPGTDSSDSSKSSNSADSSTTVVHVHTWPLIVVMFRPGYRAWRSPWRWRARPGFWRPWRRVTRSVYRSRWAKRSVRRSRYRRTKIRRMPRASHMHKSRRKTSNRYKKSKKTTNTKKKTTTTKKKTTNTKKKKSTNKHQQKKRH